MSTIRLFAAGSGFDAFGAASAMRSRGQVMPMALFAMVAVSAVLILLFNTGQRLTEKTQAVNAADAATYSASVWTARHLNFMAYSNRAMIANHVAVGHVTSFVSWVRYADEATDRIDDMANLYPPAKSITSPLSAAVKEYKEVVENGTAPAFIQAMNGAHQVYYRAQQDARASLSNPAGGKYTDLMADVAQQYRGSYQVNDDDAIDDMPDRIEAALDAAVGYSKSKRAGLVKQYRVEDNDKMLKGQVERTWNNNDDLDYWASGGIGWGPFPDLPGPVAGMQFRQKKSAHHEMSNDDTNWEFKDRFQKRTWDYTKMEWDSWDTLASGEASANDVATGGSGDSGSGGSDSGDGYLGIPGYHGLRENDPPEDAVAIPSVALISADAGVLNGKNARMSTENGPMQVGTSGRRITAASVSLTFFDRPRSCGDSGVSSDNCVKGLGEDETEKPDLFNPFWDVRRVDVTWLCRNSSVAGGC